MDFLQKQINSLPIPEPAGAIVKTFWVYILIAVCLVIYLPVVQATGTGNKYGIALLLSLIFFALSIQQTYSITDKLTGIIGGTLKGGAPSMDGNALHAVVFFLIMVCFLGVTHKIEGYDEEKKMDEQ
jgi:hypothetical protein